MMTLITGPNVYCLRLVNMTGDDVGEIMFHLDVEQIMSVWSLYLYLFKVGFSVNMTIRSNDRQSLDKYYLEMTRIYRARGTSRLKREDTKKTKPYAKGNQRFNIKNYVFEDTTYSVVCFYLVNCSILRIIL